MLTNVYLVPCWNNPSLSEKAIRSALAQPNSAVVAIDNNSPDDGATKKLWKKLEKEELKNLILLDSKKNLGWVGGVNECAKHAPKSEYITLLNNDVELPEDFTQKMLPHFKENVGAVTPIGNNISGMNNCDVQGFPDHHLVKYVIGFCVMMPSKIWELLNKELDPIFGWGLSDDLDLSHRITLLNYTLVIARDMKVFHHGSKGVALRYKNDDEYKKDLEEKQKIFVEKWGQEVLTDIFKEEPIATGTIAVPHLEMIHSDFFHSFRQLKRPANVRESYIKGTLIAKQRNELVKGMKGDWLLFIDSDMTFPADALLRLLDHNLDIVGGLCFKRVPEYNPTIYQKVPGQFKWNWIQDYPRESLFEVDGTGSAFLLIKKKVFDAIPYPWYEYNGEVSEDLYFCHKAKQAGFKIHIDSSVKIGHLGMQPVDEKFFDEYYKDKKIVL